MTADGRLWLPPGVESLARRDGAPDLDLGPFERAASDLGLDGGSGYSRVLDAGFQSQVRQTRRLCRSGRSRPWGRTRSSTSPSPDPPPEPLLRESFREADRVLEAARAFAYGSVPVIFNWGTRDLRVEVPRYEGGVRSRTLKAHVHYVSAHEVWPGDARVEVEDDELRAVVVAGRTYAADRAHIFRWDAEFGLWTGQGARAAPGPTTRRARPWACSRAATSSGASTRRAWPGPRQARSRSTAPRCPGSGT